MVDDIYMVFIFVNKFSLKALDIYGFRISQMFVPVEAKESIVAMFKFPCCCAGEENDSCRFCLKININLSRFLLSEQSKSALTVYVIKYIQRTIFNLFKLKYHCIVTKSICDYTIWNIVFLIVPIYRDASLYIRAPMYMYIATSSI